MSLTPEDEAALGKAVTFSKALRRDVVGQPIGVALCGMAMAAGNLMAEHYEGDKELANALETFCEMARIQMEHAANVVSLAATMKTEHRAGNA